MTEFKEGEVIEVRDYEDKKEEVIKNTIEKIESQSNIQDIRYKLNEIVDWVNKE